MLQEIFLSTLAKYSTDESYNLICWNEVKDLHSQPTRHYHNLDHLKLMVFEFQILKTKPTNYDTILFSLFYHDAIYDSTKKENEEQSYRLLEQRLQPTTFKYIQNCKAIIEATKTHESNKTYEIALFLDIDLAILGQKSSLYEKYRSNIRAEYSILNDIEYQNGRLSVLNRMIQSKSIYKTEFFIEKYEKRARLNILNEINLLKNGMK